MSYSQAATIQKPVYRQEIAEKVEQFKVLDRQMKSLEKSYNELKKEITSSMGEQTEAVDQYGMVIATYKEQSREGLNTKSLKIDHPSLYETYKTCTTFRVFLANK